MTSLSYKFSSNNADLAEVIEGIADQYMNAAAAGSLNKTVNWIKNEAAADVSQATGISQVKLRRRIKQVKRFKAKPKKLKARGFVGEATMPVGDITPKPKRQGAKGASYKRLPGDKADPSAFYAVMKSGRKSAFSRKTQGSLPIAEKQANIGPHLRRSVRRIMRGPASEQFSKTFLADMDKRVVKGLQRKGLLAR